MAQQRPDAPPPIIATFIFPPPFLFSTGYSITTERISQVIMKKSPKLIGDKFLFVLIKESVSPSEEKIHKVIHSSDEAVDKVSNSIFDVAHKIVGE